MSLYSKAWLFMGSAILLLITMPFWQPFVEQTLGPTWSHLALLVWAGLGFTAYVLFTCPECGCPLFKTEGSFLNSRHPWPNRICSRCGRDHAA